MNSSPSHITPIDSTESLINFDDFPSPSNHVLNPNLRITKEFSRLSNNDDHNEVQSMLGILIAHERSHLKPNPRRTQRVSKKLKQFIKTIQGKLTLSISNHPHALFDQSFSNSKPTTYMEALSGLDASN
jgi:hypothetical protein